MHKYTNTAREREIEMENFLKIASLSMSIHTMRYIKITSTAFINKQHLAHENFNYSFDTVTSSFVQFYMQFNYVQFEANTN